MKLFQIKLLFEISTDCTLPEYKTMMFRGIFGNAYRKIVCRNFSERNCAKCFLAANCEFAANFQNLNFYPEQVPPKYKKYTNFPPKFVFFVPDKSKKWQKGNKFLVYLTFFNYPKISLESLQTILKKLEEFWVDRKTQAKLIFDKVEDMSNNEVILTKDGIFRNTVNQIKLSYSKPASSQVKLHFVTPCRIINKNVRVKSDINEEILTRRMQERLRLLSLNTDDFYMPDWDVTHLKFIDRNIVYRDVKHKSYRQRRKLKLGGFTGSITISSEKVSFFHDLTVLSYMHIGSNTQGGYGKYNIEKV